MKPAITWSKIRRLFAATRPFVFVLLLVGPGYGQDHLECFRVKDESRPKATIVDIDPAQFELAEGCRILSKGREYCVPATSTVREYGPEVDPLNFRGTPLVNDYVCYRVQCPKEAPPPEDQEISDLLGTRLVRNFKHSRLCMPAVQGGAVCPCMGSRVLDLFWDGTFDTETCRDNGPGWAGLGSAAGSILVANGRCTIRPEGAGGGHNSVNSLEAEACRASLLAIAAADGVVCE